MAVTNDSSVDNNLPDFRALEPDSLRTSIRETLLAQSRILNELAADEAPEIDWIEDIEKVHERIHSVFGPLSHLNSVVSSPQLRDAYNECLPLVTEFHTQMDQNEALFRQFTRLEDKCADNPSLAELVRQTLRDFRLGGVALPAGEKEEFRQVMLALSSAQAKFEQNLMDATDAFSHHLEDASALAGLPDSIVDRGRAAAEAEGLDGWLLKLDPPTFLAVQTHADDVGLRELYYRAWVTRASALGPSPEEWDNAPLIAEILRLRARSAELLGFANFAELSLATKMADSTDQVLDFLNHLADRSRTAAQTERSELEAVAGRPLDAWDVAYYSEKLKQSRFSIGDETLRAYFPLPRVLKGLFDLAQNLFGIQIQEEPVSTLWHESARFYRITDSDGNPVGGLLTDLYTRPNKRGGAWMDSCRDRVRINNLKQNPIAYLVCNFSPPGEDQPSYLTHYDVQTLFHEFGHALHHLLTEIGYPSIAGINGVAWDAVELPSQFFENYAWLPPVLKDISAHRETGEELPDDLIERLIGSRSFLAGLAMVRQLEFALFDFRLHAEALPPDGERVREILEHTRAEVGVLPVPSFNRFQCSFAHVFGGGYAAGYYSYKWAEVLAADAFAAFDEAGPFDDSTAKRFRQSVLAVGGSRPAMTAFVDFRGREPELEPLLRQAGIS